MALCDDLDDVALDLLIVELETAWKDAMFGGGVGKVSGEGRSMEYTRANSRELKIELTAAKREKSRRDPSSEPFGALAVEL